MMVVVVLLLFRFGRTRVPLRVFCFGQSPPVGQGAQPTEHFPINLLFVLVLSVKCTLLFALFAGDRRSILLLRVGAPLAFVADEGGDYVAVLTGRRLPILFDIELTLLANSARIAFANKIRTELQQN